MKSSIRKFLLLNLLVAITITTTLTAVGNYYLDQKDIQEHLDSLMSISALSYQALLGNDLHQRPLAEIQHSLEQIPNELKHYYNNHMLLEKPSMQVLEKFNFQVWTDEGKLLLHSPAAPRVPLTSDAEGFSDKVINRQRWRVFTTYNQKAGIRTVLAERYDTRNELGHRIAQDDFYIMLLTFPLSGLLIWIIIGRGLDSLDRVAQEVADRAPSHLEPVNLKEVPEEIKPVIDEINQLLYRLQQAFEREKRFAADAAHELRTPLAALKAQAQVALNSSSIEDKDKALHKLISSVNRSTHTVQQLLTMSRLVPEAAHQQEEALFDMAKASRETIAMLVPQAVESNVDIELECDENLPLLIGNATAMAILIRNLVDNAIRYSSNDGKVTIRLFEKENRLILEVEDNGPGIPDELKVRVFERFFRVLGTKSTGTGLGLAIVLQICDLHKATIELANPKVGKGLVFRVIFPVPEKKDPSHDKLS